MPSSSVLSSSASSDEGSTLSFCEFKGVFMLRNGTIIDNEEVVVVVAVVVGILRRCFWNIIRSIGYDIQNILVLSTDDNHDKPMMAHFLAMLRDRVLIFLLLLLVLADDNELYLFDDVCSISLGEVSSTFLSSMKVFHTNDESI
jgi:hypothetical protein